MASSAYAFLSFVFYTIFLSFGSYKAEARRFNDISSLVSKGLFDSIFLHKDNNACPAKGFYTYNSFIQASRCFPQFGRTGSSITRKREVAAFLAQISHETTGGWATAPDGPFAWGLCFKEEVSPQSSYCDSSKHSMAMLSGQILQRKRTYSTIMELQLWTSRQGPGI
ncbi:hypothetical protein NC653_033110 [Populus alba x Populus x berolinensis]|uniref:Glycoside hydrolase family 19 catalytic domain-containing protein n=1 Tax=Populus alba x Populus x berolinensis TaxID=444605 RepID=A0AAD6LT70_9ROSI|nr:hypothetical protein NC653_033110 [Populus alba x Populus x berolinensis]